MRTKPDDRDSTHGAGTGALGVPVVVDLRIGCERGWIDDAEVRPAAGDVLELRKQAVRLDSTSQFWASPSTIGPVAPWTSCGSQCQMGLAVGSASMQQRGCTPSGSSRRCWCSS